MGQEIKNKTLRSENKVNTDLIKRTGPNKSYIILQLKFHHHSGSSNSESHFQVLNLQVQVQLLGLRVQVQSKSSTNSTRVRLESKSRTRVLQLCLAPSITRSLFHSGIKRHVFDNIYSTIFCYSSWPILHCIYCDHRFFILPTLCFLIRGRAEY